MRHEPTLVSLGAIAMGQAPLLFEEEFARVLANIADDRTPAGAARKIVIEITFKPDALRHAIDVHVGASSRLAKVSRGSGCVFATLTDDGIRATVGDARQPDLGELRHTPGRGRRLKAGETVTGGPAPIGAEVARGKDGWPVKRPPGRGVEALHGAGGEPRREAQARARSVDRGR